MVKPHQLRARCHVISTTLYVAALQDRAPVGSAGTLCAVCLDPAKPQTWPRTAAAKQEGPASSGANRKEVLPEIAEVDLFLHFHRQIQKLKRCNHVFWNDAGINGCDGTCAEAGPCS